MPRHKPTSDGPVNPSPKPQPPPEATAHPQVTSCSRRDAGAKDHEWSGDPDGNYPVTQYCP